MKTLQFGIEIETVGVTRRTLAEAIQSVVGGRISGDFLMNSTVTDARGRKWRVVRDGSLSHECSGEIVSPILTYEDIEELQNIIRAVHQAGARADASCGIHIHINGRRFGAKSISNLVKLIHKQERLFEHALGVSPHRLARFCRPIEADFVARLEMHPPMTMQQVSDAWYGRRKTNPTRYDASRYHGLNLNSLFFRGTIELRYFNGSTHADEVKAYLQFALAIAAKALASKTASSKRREFNPATAKYDFRVVLLHLGLIGDEFKTARLHLTKNLAGSAAWKGERRDRRTPGRGNPTTENDGHARAA